MKKLLLVVVIVLTIVEKSRGEEIPKDSSNHITLKEILFPSFLIGTGLVLNNKKIKHSVNDYVADNFGHMKSYIDDYIQFAPIVSMYGANLFGVKSKHSMWNQTKILMISELITASFCHGIKYTANIVRPNGKGLAFPSGHTSQAFVGATVLYKEYIDSNKYLAYSGYLFASLTGCYRMINKRHWISDVVAGAGMGILITNLVYHYKDWFITDVDNGKYKLHVVPQLNTNNLSLHINFTF
jgi:hypothetical protein